MKAVQPALQLFERAARHHEILIAEPVSGRQLAGQMSLLATPLTAVQPRAPATSLDRKIATAPAAAIAPYLLGRRTNATYSGEFRHVTIVTAFLTVAVDGR